MTLYASGVTIPQGLSSALSGVGNGAYNTINSNYAAAKQGAPPGSYAAQRYGTTQGLDIGNLEGALGGGEGNTAYQNQLGQREYNQNLQLAQQAAALNRPSLLDQIFQGLGSVGGTAAKAYGAWGSNAGGHGGGGQTSQLPQIGQFQDYEELL